jgi:hypothetical protein
MNSNECACLKCGKVMKNFQDPEEGLQPIGGLAFKTGGHYGSSYFDPMGDEDGDLLEIVVCDPCVEQAEDAGIVFRGRTIRPRTSTVRVEKPKKALDEPPADT